MAVEAQSPADLEFARKEAEVNATNTTRTGVGTRQKVGRTRGKGSMVIVFEQFDDAKPETLPANLQGFIDVTKADEPTLLSYLIEGYNSVSYTAASDPLAEFVNPAWPPDAQTQFRLVVRNYSRGAGVDLESAVSLIKPGFEKQFGKQ